MATLVRTRSEHRVDQETVQSDLQRNIPTPFPSQRLIDLQDDADDILNELAAETVDYDTQEDTGGVQNNIRTSIAVVQQSCLMTLANILSLSLSPSGGLHDSDHGSSTSGGQVGLEQVLAETPLACLVHTLRTRDGHRDSSSKDDIHRPAEEAALLSELHELVDAIAPSLDRRDAHLAQAIVALLIDLEQLPASIALTSAQIISQIDPSQNIEDVASKSPFAHITSLQRQLSSLQPSAPSSSSDSKLTPAETVQTALLWSRIDAQLEVVMSLCNERASLPQPPRLSESAEARPADQPAVSENWIPDRAPSFDDYLPPEYDWEHRPYERPPSYVEGHAYSSLGEKYPDEKLSTSQYPPEKVSSHASAQQPTMDTASIMEKNRSTSTTSVDLEMITHAIERLYLVAPQLSNQRVELRREKIMQMERAREGKGKSRTLGDVADPELDKMLELLGRASAREIPDQSVVIDPHRRGRERGRQDFEEQRRQYIEHLVDRSSVGRLHTQDAVPKAGGAIASPPNGADGIRDSGSSELGHKPTGSWDGKRASFPPPPSDSTLRKPTHSRLRSRSLSAPHLAWLRVRDRSGTTSGARDSPGLLARTISSDAKSLPQSNTSKSARRFSGRFGGSSKSRPTSAGGEDVSSGALDLAYVAEHHETLKHVLLFVAVVGPSSAASGGVPSAEVLPSTSSGTHGDCLFLRLAGTPSPPLVLPVPVIPGSKTVVNRRGHWEVKASCFQTGVSPSENEDGALLSASDLTSLSPWSYSCSSCSLPLVPAPPARYRDLPSEHWEELIDAWMCHPEGQTLTKAGMNGGDGGRGSGFGFWPTRQEGLVGGSYILFDAEAVANGNIKCVVGRERGDNTSLTRCICGAILGRRHDRKHEDGSSSRMYRLFKYAIRPISATSQAPKIPMSAFVLQDMLEHVQAHATYRFVLSDEEEERPRLLIWLFKPRMRISYMIPAPSLLPKSGSVDASKVLYKILGPSSAGAGIKEIVNRYPGFPQAEHLFYPMDVCRQLAALLKESTLSYPESMRTMTGLDVGWLARS